MYVHMYNYMYMSNAAGYNHLDVVEYLLESAADVNARDKGGLIPLHNASSYGVWTYSMYTMGRLNCNSTLQQCTCTCR